MIKYITGIISFYCFFACAPSENGYTISGNFESGAYNGYVYLNTPNTVDSSLVNNNRFSFRGKTDFPMQGWLTVKNSAKLAWLYVENSQISITLNNPEELKINSVTGSYSYTKQTQLQNFIDKHYQDPGFNFALKDTLTAFIKANPDHSLSGKFLGQIASESYIFSATEVENLKRLLDTTKQTNTDLFVINQSVSRLKKLGIGVPFKDFELCNRTGVTENSGHYSALYLLVDFWASWCVPCRKQNPGFVKNYQTYHHKGFDIVSISIEDNPTLWEKAIAHDNLPWHHLRSGDEFDAEIAQYYQIFSIPFNILIDKNRNIIGINLEPEKLDYTLRKLLH